MHGDKYIFIINPAAGKRDSTMEIAASVKACFQRYGFEYEMHVTDYPKHASLIVKKAALENAGRSLCFIACGGDGTLNEVAATAVDVEGASVAHLPWGTGNDFIKMFGEYVSRFSSINELCEGDTLALDYICSDCGRACNVLTVGTDARVAAGMQKYKRIPLIGRLSYEISVVENVIKGLARNYCVNIDGVDMDGSYTMIVVTNGKYYGGGYCPVPEADPADGVLDMLLVKGISRLTAIKVIDRYKAGRYKELPEYIIPMQAHEVTVFTPDGSSMEINFDGEIVISPRISFRVVPGGLHFAVPKGAEIAGSVAQRVEKTAVL